VTDSLELDDIEHGNTVRRADDFVRLGVDGPPRVLALDGGTTRKGTPQRETYGRPSGFGHQIEDGFALRRWSERMLLIGAMLMADSPDETVDTTDGAVDVTIKRAKELAGAFTAAERGTEAHEQTHLLHAVSDLQHAGLDLLDNLEAVGFTPEHAAAIRLCYVRALARWHLEVLVSEAHCCDDVWRLAGTLDRIVRLGAELVVDGVTYPAGTIVVLDLKTGQLRLKGGRPIYWLNYAVQLASYAQSVSYDVTEGSEGRSPWPWEIDQRLGLILHLDIAGMLDTDVITASLYGVDLVAGRHAGDLCVAGRAWEKRTDVFAGVDGQVAVTVEPFGLDVQLEASHLEVQLEASIGRAWLQRRIDTIGRYSDLARADLARSWPDGVATLRASTAHTSDELAAIEGVCDDVERRHSMPFGPSDPRRVGYTPTQWVERLGAVLPGSIINTKGPSSS
jgi:hypothetical protein